MPQQQSYNSTNHHEENLPMADTGFGEEQGNSEALRQISAEEREIQELLAPLCPGGASKQDQLRIKIILNLARLQCLSALSEVGLSERHCSAHTKTDGKLPTFLPLGEFDSPAGPN